MSGHERPSALAGLVALVACVLVWGALKLAVFTTAHIPISFVLPLLICVWTRRRWHLAALVAAFVVLASVKHFVVLPAEVRGTVESFWNYSFSLFNIVVGAVVIALILRLRDSLDARAEAIQGQNAELEAQAEELAQQNEEIRTQSEELAEQNEEIESQAEEMHRQNEDLVEASQLLAGREQVLQAAITGARHAEGRALEDVCGAVLTVMGSRADLIVVAETDGPDLRILAQVVRDAGIGLPERWPAQGSLAGIVLAQQRTAYVDDLERRPDLTRPFGGLPTFRSALAAPLMVGGVVAGVVKVASHDPGHWTQEHFRLLEWVAAQCGWIVEALRWQVALRDRNRAVEAANRAKDNFLAMLSHELRTPLTPVLVAVEQLIEEPHLPADVREQLQMVRRNVSVQSRLIDDLLDLTRIARGKMDLNQQPVAVADLLREIAAIVAADFAAQEQVLALELNLPEACHVMGDAARLQQVFWNLLKNSTKFSPRGATIRLRAALIPAEGVPGAAANDPGRQRVEVQVVDPGSGIAPDDLKRIFLPFEQVAAAGRRDGRSGLGLGLSIARAITELHDGTIHATSAGPGLGATFTVTLPLAVPAEDGTSSPTAAEPPAAAAADEAATKPRVLLVEDHVDTGQVMVRALRRAGYEVEHVTTISAAVARWRPADFKVLISDIGLPDGSGIDLIRQLQAQGQTDIPAICMSGYGMEHDLANSRRAGFREHLIKPVSKQKLLEAVHRLLNGQSR